MVFRPFPTIRTGGSMKIIDISQEVFSCQLYPGDPSPVMNRMMSIVEGDAYNLTGFSMCAHNGTHIDAPFHFLQNGRSVDQMGLEPYVGTCFVARHDGDVSSKDAERIIKKASAVCADKRILIAGQATVTAGAAHVFAESKILLLGNEGPTIGPLNTPAEVHLILLNQDVTLLEGIVLDGIEEGSYFLSAAPLKLGGCDGSPCRAYLIEP